MNTLLVNNMFLLSFLLSFSEENSGEFAMTVYLIVRFLSHNRFVCSLKWKKLTKVGSVSSERGSRPVGDALAQRSIGRSNVN